MKRKVSPALVGTFVLGGVVLIAVASLLFGSGRLFRHTEDFVSFFDGSVIGLRPGAMVALRGVQIGRVKEVRLVLGDSAAVGPSQTLRIPVIYELDAELIQRGGGRARIDNPADLQRLIEQGLRARLATESLVTGRLYVALDFVPDSPADFYGGPNLPYPEIPAAPTTMQELVSDFQEVVRRVVTVVRDLDLDSLVASINNIATNLDRLTTSDAIPALMANLDSTLVSSRHTLASVRELSDQLATRLGPFQDRLDSTAARTEALIERSEALMSALQASADPSSPLLVELTRTLTEFADAAAAMRRLAESLERDPSVLIRGRDPGEEIR